MKSIDRMVRFHNALLSTCFGLALIACSNQVEARCGDGQCSPSESVSTCSKDCEVPVPSRVVEVNNGPSIRGVADRAGLLVGTVHVRERQAVLQLSMYDEKLNAVVHHTILSRPVTGKGELGNPHPLRGPAGGLYMAFRDHQLDDENNPVYQLRVVRSVDEGKTWQYLNDGYGIIDRSGVGLWEPFLYFDSKHQLRVVYAKERADRLCARQGGEKQDIVMRISKDLGKTWTDERIVSGDGISRDGVPAVTRLKDGSFLAVFESWQNGTCGQSNPNLLIRSMQSSDGIDWTNRQVVFDPYTTGKKSIATWPSITISKDGRALVSFTSNFGNTAATESKVQRPETVRNFDIYLMASKGVASFRKVEWEPTSLKVVSQFSSDSKRSNRFTSSTTLADGRVLVFSGLPNRFIVIPTK